MSSAVSTSETTYDLTPKLSPYLDLHFLLPILNFLEKKNLHPQSEILTAKFNVLSKTNLVDQAKEVLSQLNNGQQLPEVNLKEKEQKLEENSKKLRTLLADAQLTQNLKQENQFNAQYLQEHHQIEASDINALFDLAKFQYESGKYKEAAENLAQFRALNTDPEKDLNALWGKLAAEIVSSNWEEAEKDVAKIRDTIEDSRYSQAPIKQLQQRAWLIHWALFVFFNTPNGLTQMLDMFLFNERYLRVIEIKTQWILRYLVVASTLTKHRVKELVKVVEQESHAYTDPITEFFRQLFVKYDFEAAEKQLELCGPVLENDYFISGTNQKDNFLNAARFAISEIFCRVHSTIDIELMAKKLGLSSEESERWIVNLIRNTKLDAKIDSAKNQVTVTAPSFNVYQQLQEKTKTLVLRALVYSSHERLKQTTNPHPAKKEQHSE